MCYVYMFWYSFFNPMLARSSYVQLVPLTSYHTLLLAGHRGIIRSILASSSSSSSSGDGSNSTALVVGCGDDNAFAYVHMCGCMLWRPVVAVYFSPWHGTNKLLGG